MTTLTAEMVLDHETPGTHVYKTSDVFAPSKSFYLNKVALGPNGKAPEKITLTITAK